MSKVLNDDDNNALITRTDDGRCMMAIANRFTNNPYSICDSIQYVYPTSNQGLVVATEVCIFSGIFLQLHITVF